MSQNQIQKRAIDAGELLKRSNDLIQSKSTKTTLRYQKLFAYALTKMRRVDVGNGTRLMATIHVADFRDAIGESGHDYYNWAQDLKNADMAQVLSQRIIINNGNGDIKGINIVAEAEYIAETKTLKLQFADSMAEYTVDAVDRFTLTPIGALLSCDSTATFKLYDLLNVHKYKINKNRKEKSYLIDPINLAALKFAMGLYEIRGEGSKHGENAAKVEQLLKEGHTEEEIFGMTDIVKEFYKDSWGNFKKKVLLKAQKEMHENDQIDFEFDFKGIGSGRGGKIRKVQFKIRLKEEVDVPKVVERYEDDNNLVNHLMDYSSGLLTNGDAVTLLRKANGDVALVKHYFDMAKSQKKINNLVGWIIKAMEGQYQEPVEVVGKPRSTGFTNYQGRKGTDYDAVERELIRQSMAEPIDVEIVGTVATEKKPAAEESQDHDKRYAPTDIDESWKEDDNVPGQLSFADMGFGEEERTDDIDVSDKADSKEEQSNKNDDDNIDELFERLKHDPEKIKKLKDMLKESGNN